MANYDPTAALAEILAPKNARAQELSELGFHQGLVIAWDSTTGSNTVNIAGTHITDVPMLNIGDTVNIQAGDTIAVLRYRNAYFIIGRVVMPNTEMFATSAVSFFSGYDSTNNYELTTSETIRATITIPIPVWANRALVIAQVNCMGSNSRGVLDYVYAAPWIETLNGPQVLQGVTAGAVGSTSSSYSRQVDTSAGGTFDVTGRTNTSGGNWTTSSFNRTALNVAVIFTRVLD